MLKIGEISGPLDFAFGDITAVGWLSDGRVFVGDQQAHSLSIFASDGDFLQRIGGEGQGPGELRYFLNVSSYRGDSLFVYDYGQRAVSVFAPDLTFARRFQNPAVEGNYWIGSALKDGHFLLFSPGVSRLPGGPGLVPDTSFIIVSSADGVSTDTIGAFEVTVWMMGADGRRLPLHLQPHGMVTGAGERVFWTEGKAFEYMESARDGILRRIVRKAHEPVLVTDEVISDFKAHYVKWLGADPEGGAERVRQSLDRGEYYSQLPATAGNLKIDALGYVWVGRYDYPGRPTEQWEVFDAEGVWMGTVTTPSGLDVHEIGRDRIIGVAKDDYDVPYVQVHQLRRR